MHNWPQTGNINIEDLYLKYRPNLPCVIKGITAEIKPSEKIGIVGRTGAGKSTITLSLLRIIESFKGMCSKKIKNSFPKYIFRENNN